MASDLGWLKEALRAYNPPLGYDTTHKLTTLDLLERGERVLYRDFFAPGHISASAWVVNPKRTRVLLLQHKTLSEWFQPGGHADGEGYLPDVALRELEEETGYTRAVMQLPRGDAIFHVDVHPIPERIRDGKMEPLHLHYDVRFLVEIDDSLPIPGSAEQQVVRWMENKEAEAHFPINHGRWTMLQLARKD